MNALFNLGVKETDRSDIVLALLQGIPGLNQHKGSNAGKPVDTLKINLGIAAVGDREPARRPRWRPRRLPERPPARATTWWTSSCGSWHGILLDPPDQVTVPLGDGVDQNEKPFSTPSRTWPAPDSGFDVEARS